MHAILLLQLSKWEKDITQSNLACGSGRLPRKGHGTWLTKFLTRSTRFPRVRHCTTSPTRRCTAPRLKSFTLVTHPDTTGQSSHRARIRLSTALAGTIRLTLDQLS